MNVLPLFCVGCLLTADPGTKLHAWDTPLRGAVYSGYYSQDVEQDLDAAQGYGFGVVRLFFPGIQNEDTISIEMPGAMSQEELNDWDSGYFNSDRFEKALENLDNTIAEAHERGMKVVVSPGLVPGSHARGPLRWRLYRKARWHHEFAGFWARLAERYRDNPAVVGYLLLNEPGFEITQDLDFDDPEAIDAYYKSIEGTPADLNVLYRRVVESIRAVDAGTPIIVHPGQYGRPQALKYLEPIDDERIIYSVHWYGPWLYTTWRHNRERWSYPGPAPSNTAGDPDAPGPLVDWNIDTLRERFADPVRAWQERHGIPSSRVYVGEFSADRRVEGAERWMGDMLTILHENGWHWTYYMFREREWNAMDHELGPVPSNTLRADTPTMKRISEAVAKEP